MTREEAIKTIESAKHFAYDIVYEEAFDMAIKALEQEPCEDAVSRYDVVRIVQHNNPPKALEKIRKLTSVTPQEPRKGYWIKHNTPNGTYYYDCSLCGCVAPRTETADSYLWKLSNFCPDCGAKMNKEEKEI